MKPQLQKMILYLIIPDSRYAAILNNPESAALEDENSPENIYESVYEKHENQKYAEVISKCETTSMHLTANPLFLNLNC